MPRILAFRPATAVERLAPRSRACPLSARELLGAAAELGVVLPVVRAPLAAVARAALVAASELQGAIGLSLPPAVHPERWFAAVTGAADEVAGGLPILLCAEVAVEGEAATDVDRALRAAWRLVRAGVTHLAVDVGAVTPGERGRVLTDLVQAAAEHGIGVEAVLPLGEGAGLAERAAAMFEEMAWRGAAPDAAGVRCPAPATADEARLQAGALALVRQALAGVPVVRRGPVAAALVEPLRGSPIAACDDGGWVAARALALVPPGRRDGEADEPGARDERGGETALERAAARLDPAEVERLEACAYVDAIDLMERLGAGGSAPALARALERRLDG